MTRVKSAHRGSNAVASPSPRPAAPVVASGLLLVATIHTAGAQVPQAWRVWRDAVAAIYQTAEPPQSMRVRLSGYLLSPGVATPGLPVRFTFHGDSSFEWEEQLARGGWRKFVVYRDWTQLSRAGEQPKKATERAHARFRTRWAQFAIIYLLRFPEACPVEFVDLEPRAINGRRSLGVAIKGPCSSGIRAWFADDDFRLTALEAEAVLVGGGTSPAPGAPIVGQGSLSRPTTVMLMPSDFRRVDGVSIPHQLSIVSDEWWESIVITSARIEPAPAGRGHFR